MLIFDQLNKADKHLRVLSWLVAAGIATLLAGLWWVQIVRARQYAEDLRVQSFRTVRVPAPRGKIFDRNGVVLAENRPTYNLSLYLEDRSWREAVQKRYKQMESEARKGTSSLRKPKSVERFLSMFGYKPKLTQPRRLNAEERSRIARASRFLVTSNIVWQLGEALGQPLAMTNEVKFHQHYDRRRALPLPIYPNLTPDLIARFQEQGTRLPGVDMEIQPLRTYPLGTNAAHVIGCLTRTEESADDELAFFNYRLPDYRGLYGIEASFDEQLRGRAGAKSVLVNNLGYRQSESIVSPIEPGKNVTLTLDSEIQKIAEQWLNRATPPLTRGAAVVLDVRTGEVIAMASSPTFDPNDWVPFLPFGIAQTYTNESIAPLQNRATYGNFHPGSTFKVVVAFAGLEAGTLNTNDIVRVEPNPRDPAHGFYYAGNRGFRDTAPPGDYNFRRALIKSSNGYFIEQGLRVTPERIVEMAQRFHFGEKTGIPLQESRGTLPTRAWMRENGYRWSPPATGNLSIGQGWLDVTPLQMALAMAAVANGGKVLTPQIIANISAAHEPGGANGHLRPIVRDQLPASRASIQIVQEAMLADVEDPEGTAYKAFRVGAPFKAYRIGGKTGTAQVFKGERFDHYTTWFASWCMTDEPKYAVVVMVDHGSSGGGTCAPVAREIYRALEYREQRLAMPRKPNLVIN